MHQRTTSPIRAVVFDLGGVLIDWDRRHLYRRLFDGNEAAMERFLTEVCSMDWNASMDAGRPFAISVEELAREHPEARDLILAYNERWPEMLGGPIQGTVAIVDELRRAGLATYALSNWSAEKFPVARARFGFLGWFDGIVISGEVGICKPDPRIYRAFLDRFPVDPARAIYVDDHEPNVVAAAEAGFDARRFRGADALRQELVAAGLLRPTARTEAGCPPTDPPELASPMPAAGALVDPRLPDRDR